MDRSILDSIGGPHFHLAVGNARWAYIIVWEERNAGRLSMYLRGRKMRSVVGMFDQFAAAYQFPYYFGENGAAFSECLRDLDWFTYPERGYLALVADAADLLADAEPPRLEATVSTLTDVVAEWAEPVDRGDSLDRPAYPFHVIFHETPDREHLLHDRLTRAGAVIGATWREHELDSTNITDINR